MVIYLLIIAVLCLGLIWRINWIKKREAELTGTEKSKIPKGEDDLTFVLEYTANNKISIKRIKNGEISYVGTTRSISHLTIPENISDFSFYKDDAKHDYNVMIYFPSHWEHNVKKILEYLLKYKNFLIHVAHSEEFVVSKREPMLTQNERTILELTPLLIQAHAAGNDAEEVAILNEMVSRNLIPNNDG